MKKILHIAEAFGSGVLSYIKNLSRWQCEEYKVYIAYGIRPETPENFMEQFDSRVTFIKVQGFTREIRLLKDGQAFFHIKQIVKEINPNLIHLHSTKAGVIGRWAINCNKYHVLYSPHAYSFLMVNCNRIMRKIYMYLERISDRKKCLTIADIDGELEASQKVTKNAICIPNGINLEEMNNILSCVQVNAKEKSTMTVCMLGKIVPQKSPELFNEIAKEFPNIDFLWIGDGPFKKDLTSKNITITGWLNRTDAMIKILESDIFLFPSAWESLSIALLEVMYSGKPCIVSTADGNRDVIQNGKNGYVCKKKDEYVEALQMLIKNPELGKKYGEQA